MITHSDEGPDHDPDDPLTVILRPPTEYLGAPAGRYEAIRRGASRRRVLRAAAGAALTCGVAVLVVLPLRLTTSDDPASPVVPLAPPPASSPSTSPPPTSAPEAVTPTPTRGTRTADPSARSRPSRAPSASASVPASRAPTATSANTRSPSIAPSAARTGVPTAGR